MDFNERGYFSDQYKLDFTSRVRLVEDAGDSRSIVYLDRTFFYPESGGQPDDRGILGGNSVLAVNEDEKGVAHLIEGSLEVGAKVEGIIERERRYDHMRQHSGQHLISRVFFNKFNLNTVGFHMGESVSTIDLDGEIPAAENLKDIEIELNILVMNNIGISSNVVSAAEFNKLCSESNSNCLKRSKLPGNKEDVRLVEIDEMDVNPCCGTHVSNTGEIGIIKIVGVKRVNKNSRIEFLCGLRGVRDYIEKDALLKSLSSSFSTGWSKVGEIVEKLSEENIALKKKNRLLTDKLNVYTAERLAVPDSSIGRFSIVKKVVKEIDMTGLRNLAGNIRENSNVIILFGGLKPTPGLIFACSADVPVDMGEVLKEAALIMGAHGGGSKDFAQGGGGNAELVQSALDRAEILVKEKLE